MNYEEFGLMSDDEMEQATKFAVDEDFQTIDATAMMYKPRPFYYYVPMMAWV